MPRKPNKTIKKGKGWKLTQNPYSGNLIVSHSGKEYVFNESSRAQADKMIEAFRAVKAKRSTRKSK